MNKRQAAELADENGATVRKYEIFQVMVLKGEKRAGFLRQLLETEFLGPEDVEQESSITFDEVLSVQEEQEDQYELEVGTCGIGTRGGRFLMELFWTIICFLETCFFTQFSWLNCDVCVENR